MIDGLPLSFFLPLVVHALAGLTTGVTGVLAFRAPKRRGHHYRWGKCYLWVYSVVFLTATLLSVQHWSDNAHLIPGLKQLPTLTFWVLPTVIALPFIVLSLFRFAPKTARAVQGERGSFGGN
ncbi:MAG: hypothetical protein H0U76_24690 [Ktedonobacteraceae bacterium]|nr:hypothetical protein [Ktedonobacteraceae bacterium]